MPVGRPLGLLFRQQLCHFNRHPHSRTIAAPSVFSLSTCWQSRTYSSPPPANRKLNLPIDFNASSLLAHSSTTALANPELPGDVRASATTKMNYFQAVNDALATILEEDEKACVFGEDVAFGGMGGHHHFLGICQLLPGWLVAVCWG